MFGKKNFLIQLLFLSSSVLACTNPHYVNEGKIDNSPKGADATCQIQFNNFGYCLSWDWEVAPTNDQVGSLIFKIFELTQSGEIIFKELKDAPAVVLWMPGMGHGSSPTQVELIEPGVYRAKQVFFVMPGHWEIKFQLRESGVVKDEVSVSILI